MQLANCHAPESRFLSHAMWKGRGSSFPHTNGNVPHRTDPNLPSLKLPVPYTEEKIRLWFHLSTISGIFNSDCKVMTEQQLSSVSYSLPLHLCMVEPCFFMVAGHDIAREVRALPSPPPSRPLSTLPDHYSHLHDHRIPSTSASLFTSFTHGVMSPRNCA